MQLASGRGELDLGLTAGGFFRPALEIASSRMRHLWDALYRASRRIAGARGALARRISVSIC